MIPQQKKRQVSSSGVTEKASFGISEDDTAHIATILRDTLYSDKVLAVLREYSANAWDSHRTSGKADVPIRVVLPTPLDPSLVIQDFGSGISHEAVFRIYTKYGKSTKRKDNDAVGMLGIGSKSAFAYSDSFTIISCHGGVRRTYVSFLDETEIGVINLMAEEPCGDETGVTIQVAVRPDDIAEFERKAKDLFSYFKPRPDINVELPPPEEGMELKNGTISQYNHGWYAVMGCVPYRINLSQLKDQEGNSRIPDYISNVGGTLNFKIGEVQVNASREDLKYSDQTKKVLVKRFNDLVDEYVTKMLDEIEGGSYSDWEKMLKGHVLYKLKLPIPDKFDFLRRYRIVLPKPKEPLEPPRSFIVLTKERKDIDELQVSEKTRLVLKDDSRALRGFPLQNEDRLIYPNNKSKWDVIKKDLDALCKELRITGIPIVTLSSLPWHVPTDGRKPNIKHKVTSFKLVGLNSWGKNLSKNWDIVSREPTEKDVYVLINGFVAEDCNIFSERREDQELAQHLKIKLPDIYGYKSTLKAPFDESSIVGTPYRKWKKRWLRSLVTPEVIEQAELRQWEKIVQAYISTRRRHPKHITTLEKNLGPRHPITTFFNRQLKNARKVSRKYDKLIETLNAKGLLPPKLTEPQELMDTIYRIYPLLKRAHITSLWDDDKGPEVYEYIRLIDADLARTP